MIKGLAGLSLRLGPCLNLEPISQAASPEAYDPTTSSGEDLRPAGLIKQEAHD